MHRSICLTILFCVCSTALADDLVLHVGTLLAVPGEPTLKNRTIVISDNKITEVIDGFVDPAAGSRLLDLKDQFVLPGLMDMHVHLLMELGPESKLRSVTENDTFTVLRGASNARKTLFAGFTTVRDLGGFTGVNLCNS